MTARLLPSKSITLPFALCMVVALGTLGFARHSDAASTAASLALSASRSASDGDRNNDAAMMHSRGHGSVTQQNGAQNRFISASDGWVRWLPANAPMAAYMLLTNQGSEPVTLVSASSPRFKQVMLHQSVERSGQGEGRDGGGIAQMRMVESLVLPPHRTVAIAPGGYHLMMMSPPTPVGVGEQIPVTLRFSDGQVLDVTLPVSPPTRMR